ncbi:MAG: hypothetical protein QW175_07995, partial [Candidatus Bathyarchaeia archaeon]
VDVYRMWNYDSMFIWVEGDSDSYGRLGYDDGAPYDGYSSLDRLVWNHVSRRYWFRVNMTGETVGDLPVSGTINTIEVPSVSTSSCTGFQGVSAGGQLTLISLKGCGRIEYICLYTNYEGMRFSIKCDGVEQYFVPLSGINSFQHQAWRLYFGDLGAGLGVMTTKHDTTNNNYADQITVKLNFKRSFEIIAINPDTNPHTAAVVCVYNLIA